jgi:transcriptional regulator with XRE-family HTH domain
MQRKEFRQFREHFGLSLAEVAEEASLSEATLSYFEAGKRELSQDSIDNLKRAVVKVAEEKIERLRNITKMSFAVKEMINTSSNLVDFTVGRTDSADKPVPSHS